jgi:hypothetical protein
MRQLQIRDPSQWRPVRRVMPDGQVTLPLPDSSSAHRDVKRVPSPAPSPDHVSVTSASASPSTTTTETNPSGALPAPGTSHRGLESEQLAAIRKRMAAKHAATRLDKANAHEEHGISSASTCDGPSQQHLQLCSYNVWFGPHHQEARMVEVARIIDQGDDGKARPGVVALQELTPDLERMLRAPLAAAGFTSFFKQPYETYPAQNRYGVALATRPPFGPLKDVRWEPYQGSRMLRGLASGTTVWPGLGNVAVGATHLESFIGAEEDCIVVSERRKQLRQAMWLLEAQARDRQCVGAILLGDMNWNDHKDGNADLQEGWADAFLSLGKPRGTASTCHSWRFDRCFYWTNPTHSRSGLQAVALELGGTKQIGELTFPNRKGGLSKLFPSDHRAVLVTMGMDGGHCDSAAVPSAAPSSAAPKLGTQQQGAKDDQCANGGGTGNVPHAQSKRRRTNSKPHPHAEVVCLSDSD